MKRDLASLVQELTDSSGGIVTQNECQEEEVDSGGGNCRHFVEAGAGDRQSKNCHTTVFTDVISTPRSFKFKEFLRKVRIASDMLLLKEVDFLGDTRLPCKGSLMFNHIHCSQISHCIIEEENLLNYRIPTILLKILILFLISYLLIII